ncbi:MAG: AMMECR1 domain-containing protein, partial [Candidatus Binatia bacterium]
MSGDCAWGSAERAWLLAHARAAIAEELGIGPADPTPVPESCARLGAVFVTLDRSGELRGCVGTLVEDRTLADVVAAMAVAAA